MEVISSIQKMQELAIRVEKEGKKIGWKDGIRAIWCILKYNL